MSNQQVCSRAWGRADRLGPTVTIGHIAARLVSLSARHVQGRQPQQFECLFGEPHNPDRFARSGVITLDSTQVLDGIERAGPQLIDPVVTVRLGTHATTLIRVLSSISSAR